MLPSFIFKSTPFPSVHRHAAPTGFCECRLTLDGWGPQQATAGVDTNSMAANSIGCSHQATDRPLRHARSVQPNTWPFRFNGLTRMIQNDPFLRRWFLSYQSHCKSFPHYLYMYSLIASSYGNQSTEPMIGDLLLHVLGDLQKVRFTEKIINNTTSTGTKLHGQKQEIVPASKKPPNILKQMHCYQLRNEKKPCKPLHFLNSFTNSTCRAASHLSHFLHII